MLAEILNFQGTSPIWGMGSLSKLLDQATIVDPSTKEVVYALAQQDMVALRIVMRLGWEVPNPINGLKEKESERFPFAILKSGV